MGYRSLASACVLAAAVALSGCASQGPLKAYDGPPRTVAEVAILAAPEQVEVMSIDGREPPPGFLRSQTRLALLPGEHVLSLRYVELFPIGSDDHEVIRSKQAALRFRAEPGRQYRIDVPALPGREAARAFARDPQFRLVDEQDGQVTESVAIRSYAEASLIDTIGKAFEGRDAAPGPVTSLDLLKDVWSRSSAEEREAFRNWIASPPESRP